ncbi:transposase [Georgenia sp. EYE_87]|uniref:transposase n=1 Tax=Georgenia sp. EYE_87 TaxID=2853448 RepID=UPI0020031E8E|nr:transposase [Georgenia sp. EYE_87]MCK6211479.1 transposase [Georgenia sp. EYE_87]
MRDLVPGRSGKVYETWLQNRGEEFKAGVKVATLDPFRGYQNAIDEELEDAAAVLDAFHVTKLGVDVVDEVRRRVQQDATGHRGRRDDPLDKVRNVLRAGANRLTERQWDRLERHTSRPGTPTARSSSPGSATSVCARSATKPT